MAVPVRGMATAATVRAAVAVARASFLTVFLLGFGELPDGVPDITWPLSFAHSSDRVSTAFRTTMDGGGCDA
ncbi:hypothetical protein ABT124_51575, partial [Streptomyces sp. NPDC001982]|uniref:hypothetical protein n=1 Tax=Streptomyces sp. NPDC001982 TaxID=3154405 RepID=UPI00332FC4F3